MQRRQFLSLFAGVAAAWPLSVPAQQRERRVAMLLPASSDNAEYQARVDAFLQGLQQLGWTGGNLRIDTRWAGVNAERVRQYAAELAALAPDVILAHGSTAMDPLLKVARSVPIVFVAVIDPVGSGLVDSLARPGGNATGFTQFEYSFSGKWLELLKEIAPRVTRVAVLRNPGLASGPAQFGIVQALARSLGVEVVPVNMRDDPGEIERAVRAFARTSTDGMIVTANTSATAHRELIIGLAAQHKLPTVYFDRLFAAAGGLVSYGSIFIDQYRQAAGYVDRILRGEKPADLPVQAPTKYETVINLKTAKALGLTVPPTLLATADEVIE